MFERFTKGARTTVTGAVTWAERAGADRVTEEHLLLALLDRKGSRSSFALASLGGILLPDAYRRESTDWRG